MSVPHRRLATARPPGLHLTDHAFEVPLDHQHPEAGSLTVFAREVVDPRRVADDLPTLVFLQGGPGFGAPRPMDASGWLGRALETHRVLLLDERGTGRSSPVTAHGVQRLGSPDRQAAYLRHFRSDSIVADCELVRLTLQGDRPWTVLGQSYGGFCVTRYLSAAPEGLAGACITGGLPGLEATADDVYRRTYPLCEGKNRAFQERYPQDGELLRRIARHLATHDERLPCGDRLTPERLQMLGLLLGFSDGFELVHYLLEDAFVEGDGHLSAIFLKHFEQALHHDTNPVFAVLHEACYTQGAASRWSAQRLRAEHPLFDPEGDGPLYLTGEMIYPWMFEEIGALAPLREAAQLLAEDTTWPRLYDSGRLARNSVPVAAAVYLEDMYVPTDLSLATAQAIPGLRTWVTNEYEHNGLRADGARVLGRLLDMLDGRA